MSCKTIMFCDPNWQRYEIIQKLMVGDGQPRLMILLPKLLLHLWFLRSFTVDIVVAQYSHTCSVHTPISPGDLAQETCVAA